LYLRLSLHLSPDEGKSVLGLSLDEEASRAARDSDDGGATATGEEHVHESSIDSRRGASVVLRAGTDTVVLAVEGTGQPRGESEPDADLRVALTPDGVFKIQSASPSVSLVPMTPLLALLATGGHNKCRAKAADGVRCRLKKTHSGWCFFHLEHKVLLHDEELERRKGWHEDSRQNYGYMGRGTADNITNYNHIQMSLALRVLITEILYAGDNDDGHRQFVKATLGNRSNLATHLKTVNKSDGSGRKSITECIDDFLDMARAREANPTSSNGWKDELVVKLVDVSTIRASLPHGGPTPLVSELLSAPGSSVMMDILRAKAERLGDLPSLDSVQDEASSQVPPESQRAWPDQPPEEAPPPEPWVYGGPSLSGGSSPRAGSVRARLKRLWKKWFWKRRSTRKYWKRQWTKMFSGTVYIGGGMALAGQGCPFAQLRHFRLEKWIRS
jgi:hypothetical protein